MDGIFLQEPPLLSIMLFLLVAERSAIAVSPSCIAMMVCYQRASVALLLNIQFPVLLSAAYIANVQNHGRRKALR